MLVALNLEKVLSLSTQNAIDDAMEVYRDLISGIPIAVNSQDQDEKIPLDRLKRLRLTETSPENPDLAISPVPFSQVPQRAALALDEIVDDLSLLSRILSEGLPQSNSESSSVMEIAGINQVVTGLGGMVTGARVSIDSLLSKPPSESELRRSSFTDSAITKRGLRCRTISPLESRLLEYSRVHARQTSVLGAEHRVSAITPFRMVVADSSQAMIIWRDGEEVRAIYVEEPHLAFPLATLFELIWKDAQPFLADNNYLMPITDEEQIVILLLADGFSNQYIASKLNKDERTVRRIIGRLMEKADVDNQFQLGIEATKLGWLPQRENTTGAPN